MQLRSKEIMLMYVSKIEVKSWCAMDERGNTKAYKADVDKKLRSCYGERAAFT